MPGETLTSAVESLVVEDCWGVSRAVREISFSQHLGKSCFIRGLRYGGKLGSWLSHASVICILDPDTVLLAELNFKCIMKNKSGIQFGFPRCVRRVIVRSDNVFTVECLM